ncbi:MAG: tripartite tricarboxylate transporter substrate binding protein [Burkholderiales bacterium]
MLRRPVACVGTNRLLHRALWVLAASLAAFFSVGDLSAQNYPSRSVRVIVGLAPGGGTDTVGRIMTQKLAEAYGQSFVVDNRPSAGGNVAGELLARATPDGYTLLVTTPTHVVNPSLYKDLRYDAIKDFAPVALIVYSQYYLSVSNGVPVNSVGELLSYAKGRTQPLSYASSGIGSANHLSGELFRTMSGINIIHVPYKGGAPALNALVAGEVQLSFTSSAAIPHAKAGRLKTIAVTGSKRTPIAPHIPTISESGVPGYEVVGWYGLTAPAKTPKAVIDRLNRTINEVLPELRERYQNIGMDLGGGTAAEFGAFLKSERDKWARVVKLSGAKVE